MSARNERQAEALDLLGRLNKPTKKDEDYRFSDPEAFTLDLPLISEEHAEVPVGHLAEAVIAQKDSQAVVAQIVDGSTHVPANLPDGVIITGLDTADQALLDAHLGRVVRAEEDYFTAATLAKANVGLVVHIAKNTEVAQPIVLDIALTTAGLAAQWVLIVAEQGAKATVVVDQHGGVAGTTVLNAVETVLAPTANLTLVTAQDWEHKGLAHITTHRAQVNQDASLVHLEVSLKGNHVYVRPDVELTGRGAEGKLLGVYLPTATDHIEHRSLIHHVASDTMSEYNHKGVICDAGRATWVGTIKIQPDAKNTSSDESNANLILTDGRADSLPFLEIGTADVAACGHHSSIGQIDENQLFYLQSRGIDRVEARRMLVLAFLAEVIDEIDVDGLSDVLMDDISAVIAQ